MTWPYNHHAHTPFGDGHSTAGEHAAEAARRGMRSIGISEHAPLGDDIEWTLALDHVDEYHADLMAVRSAYRGRVQILAALETDWWPARNDWWDRIDRSRWDYLIGSVHFIDTASGTLAVDSSAKGFEEGLRDAFGGDIRALCDAFFECERKAASSGRFDILGHCDLVKKFNKDRRFFDTGEAWYREMAISVVREAARSGIIIEVNTAGLDKPVGEFYPAPWLVEACVEQGVRLMINSDAHSINELQRHFDTVVPELSQLGVQELWRFHDGEWEAGRISPVV